MLNNVATAKKELSTILKKFVERKAYTSSHFVPYRFLMKTDATTGAAELEFELSPSKAITMARWDCKIFTYMPDWQARAKNPGAWQTQLQMESDAYDILHDHGNGITDSAGMLPILMKEVVTAVKELKEWDYVLEEALAHGRDVSGYGVGYGWDYIAGPGPWFGPLLGETKRYHGEYPYIVDIENMRILSPDLAKAFHRAKDSHKKRFLFETLNTLAALFPTDSPVPDNIKDEFEEMKGLLAAIDDIGTWLRPFFLQIVIDNISSDGLECKIPELLVTSKNDNVIRSCCEILLKHKKVVWVPQKLQNKVQKLVFEYKLDKAARKR
jgi:hypothetical protein